MTSHPIEVEVLVPDPHANLMASVELLVLHPRDYSGLCLATRLVARELLEYSFGPAAEQVFRPAFLAQILGLNTEAVIKSLEELRDRQLIELEVLNLAPPLSAYRPYIEAEIIDG